MSRTTLEKQSPPERLGPAYASSLGYPLPVERPLWAFLALSFLLLALTAVGAAVAIRPELPPKTLEIDLNDIEAVPGEPPPKGDTAESVPTPPPAATPEPTPEATPEPTPEPTPPPVEKPEFIKPEATPTPPPPPPKPRPVVNKPAPPPPARPAAAQQTPAPANTGTHGTPSGTVGARGGSRGDFIAAPHPQYDLVAVQHHYQGSGEVLIAYSNGSINSVSMAQSTGVSYLDAKTISWVRSRYRVKPGASGRASFHISWVLPTGR